MTYPMRDVDYSIANVQRQISVEIVKRRDLLNSSTRWQKPLSEFIDHDLPGLDTDIEKWFEEDKLKDKNLGLRLIGGTAQLTVNGPWRKDFFSALKQIEPSVAALGYGFEGRREPIYYPLKLADGGDSVSQWRELWPKPFAAGSEYASIELKCSLKPTKTTNPPEELGFPLPGSFWRLKDGAVVPLVWFAGGDRSVAGHIADVSSFIAETSLDRIVRAAAYGTLLHHLRLYLEGNDWGDFLSRLLGGFLARVVIESADLNRDGSVLKGKVWAPVADDLQAKNLIGWLALQCDALPKDTIYWFEESLKTLSADPSSIKPPGWKALARLFGERETRGLRHAFKCGADVSVLDQFAERYAYNLTSNLYIDRDAILTGLPTSRTLEHLCAAHAADTITTGKKTIEAFRVYAKSRLRLTISDIGIYPDHEPGAIVRVSKLHGILPEGESAPNSYLSVNVFPGFHVQPTRNVDQALMTRLRDLMDRMFMLLTADHPEQVIYIHKFIGYTIQHPEAKQQMALIIVGDQGVGKSWFGSIFLQRLFGHLWNTISGSSLNDKFWVGAFRNRLIVYIDEFIAEGRRAIENLKLLIRQDAVAGELKGIEQDVYRNLARIVIGSNRTNIGLAPSDASDRANFFIKCHTAQSRGLTAEDFRKWALSVAKPLYAEFEPLLGDPVVLEHLMRHFRDIEVTRDQLEDLTDSSREDQEIATGFETHARKIAKIMIETARVWPDRDIIAWFNDIVFNSAVKRVADENGWRNVAPAKVMEEFKNARIIEVKSGTWFKFKYKYATLIEEFGRAIGHVLVPQFPLLPDDYGLNDVASFNAQPEWRGRQAGEPRPDFENDYM